MGKTTLDHQHSMYMTTPEPLEPVASSSTADEPAPTRVPDLAERSSKTKFFFTDSQRATLKEHFYKEGINSTSKEHSAAISQIATEISATETQVKVGIAMSLYL